MTFIGPLSLHLFIPAMPAVKEAFGATTAITQLTMSLAMMSMAVFTVAYGGLSDRFGRKRVLLGGLLLFTAGAAACLLAMKPQPTDADLDSLVVFNGTTSFTPAFEGTLGLTGTAAMGADTNRLFLRISGAGVLVVDTTNAATPTGRSFLRTLGWGSHLEFSADTMYVAAGNFGVFQRNLSSATLAP